jgi:hypothetical protein
MPDFKPKRTEHFGRPQPSAPSFRQAVAFVCRVLAPGIFLQPLTDYRLGVVAFAMLE